MARKNAGSVTRKNLVVGGLPVALEINPAPESWDGGPDVQTVDRSEGPGFVATAEDIEKLKQRLAKAQQSQEGHPMGLDESLGCSFREYRGKTFKIIHPSLFERRDILQALAGMREYEDLAREPDNYVKLKRTAEAQEKQIAAILPQLEILDTATMQFRPATIDEAGYRIGERALREILFLILQETTAAEEMERAGITDVK